MSNRLHKNKTETEMNSYEQQDIGSEQISPISKYNVNPYRIDPGERKSEKMQNMTEALSNRKQQLKEKLAISLPKRNLGAAYTKKNPNHSLRSRSIPSEIRHEIFLRDGGMCTYVDPLTGKKCECRTNLELDHIHPFALGGDHSVENLRLLCRAHNQLRSTQTYGQWGLQR